VSPGVLSLLRWSRGNEILCAIGQQEVLVFGPTPGIAPKRIRVPETSQVADVVPDGSALILLDSERLIHLDRATGREQILTRGFPIQQPRVSLDGRLIVYLSNETGQWTLRVAPLTRAEITHSIEIATLPVGVGRARLTQWTADGRLMTEASVATDNIYGMRLEDGRGDARLERLVHNSPYASVPLLSPDDRQIVYHGSGSMNAMQADGSGERPIGPSGVPLSWLSSGELVFWPADNERTLAALDLETSGIRLMGHEIPPNAAAASTALASDSFQYIGFTDELWIRRFVGDRAHFFVRRAGAAERAVMHLPRLTEWRISPQGDRIAYQLRGQQSTGRSGVIHLRTVGADDDKVIGTGGALKWTADGHKLVFRTEGEKAIEFRRYDVTTGQTATVLDARHVDGVFPADSTWNISHCSLATDESFLVCQAMVTTVQRLAWAGVTYDAVIAKLSQR
jgi:dipeptidyl aminopeptidase/acylaminoacyl peptidase